jgi:hypothetical protein
MKNFLLICFFSLLTQLVNGQINDSAKTKSALLLQQYNNAYKVNRTRGRVFLGVGLGVTVIGGIIFANYANQGFNGPSPTDAPLILGPIITLASIPFFISARHNKNKAALLLKSESTTIGYGGHAQLHYTAMALQISL